MNFSIFLQLYKFDLKVLQLPLLCRNFVLVHFCRNCWLPHFCCSCRCCRCSVLSFYFVLVTPYLSKSEMEKYLIIPVQFFQVTFEGIAGSTFSHIAIDDVIITSGKCQEQTDPPTASASATGPLLPSVVYPMLYTGTSSPTSTLSTVTLPAIKPSLSSELTASLSALSTFQPSLSSSLMPGIVNFQFWYKPLY